MPKLIILFNFVNFELFIIKMKMRQFVGSKQIFSLTLELSAANRTIFVKSDFKVLAM